MLETIKMLNGIKDNTKDLLINFYIKEVTKVVLDFCNRTDLNDALESFITFKVSAIIKATSSTDDTNGTNSAQSGLIQSIHRGDTTITYATGANTTVDANSDFSPSVMLSANEKRQLTKHRKLKFI